MPNMVTKNIEIHLQDLMDKRYMNIQRLHKQSGLSRTIISDLLNGKSRSIQLETIYKLCKSLDCEIGELIEFKK
jgi:putative transcriptional regulator